MELKTKNIALKDLKPYDGNPRDNEEAIEMVARSIEDYGYRNPIIVDKDMNIIAGHTRLAALKRLGKKKAVCIIADDLTNEQARAFRLADNKVAELAGWDFKKLAEELDDIDDPLTVYGIRHDIDNMKNLDDLDDYFGEPRDHSIECPHCGARIER